MGDITTDSLSEVTSPSVERSNPRPKKKSRTLNPPRNRKKKERIRAKKFFLTFPQCEVEPQLALTRLIFKFPNLKWVIVAKEAHADGTPHLHLVFWLAKAVHYSRADFWNFIALKHGNYQVVRKIVKVVKYVTKGNDFLSHGIDVKTWLLSKSTKKGANFELVAGLMQAGESIEQIDDKHNGMVCQNLEKLQRYKIFLSQKARKLEAIALEPWVPLEILTLPLDFRPLGRWLNNNLNLKPRPFKQRQLWLHGPTNSGKTSLVMSLMKHFGIYWVPMDTPHLDDYDESYDVVVLDEFKGQKSITWMNGFVSGSPFKVFRRYHSFLKTKNVPVIVLSNYSIEEAYGKVHMYNPERLDSLKGRFLEVHVSRFINIL